jgi:hypothetical protein
MSERIVLQEGTSNSYKTIDLILQHPEEYIVGCDIGNAVVEGFRDWNTGELPTGDSAFIDPRMRIFQGGLDLVNYSTSHGQYSELDFTRRTAIERGMFSAVIAKTTNIQSATKKRPSIKERVSIWRNQ